MTLSTRLYRNLFGGVIITILAMALQNVVPGAGLIALAGVLTLPGVLLLLLLRLERLSRLEQVVYASGLSLLMLMVSGLVSNEILAAWGNHHPLAAAVQVPWTSAVLLGLLAGAWWRNRRHRLSNQAPAPTAKGVLGATALLGLPALSAAGAIMLNNGGPSTLALAAYGLVAAVAVGLVATRRRVAPWVWGWAVFCMGLALLWSTSLRGAHITGHDIQLEYYVFRLTDTVKYWSMSHLQDAYNACLSITILPTVLKSVSGAGAEVLYKVVYQLPFALTAVGVFGLARRYVSAAVAFIAAFIYITFPTFFTDMAMLTRQEIAFVFFSLLLLTVFNQRIAGWPRRWLVLMLSAGVVLSHYSTTFVMVGLLGGAWALLLPGRLLARFKPASRWARPGRPSITLATVLVGAVCTMLWTGVYTKTGDNIAAQIAKVGQALPTILHPDTSNDTSAYTIPKGLHLAPQAILDLYTASHHHAAEVGGANKAGGFYANAANYPLVAENAPLLPATGVGAWLKAHGADPNAIAVLGKTGYALGVQVAILLGAVFAFAYRRRFHLSPDLVVMAPVAIGLLIMQVVLPVIDYGLFRMLQQDLAFLGLLIVLGARELLAWIKIRSEQVRQVLIVSGFALAFLVTSGFAGQILGGAPAQLPLSNSGFYYDAYYTDDQDLSLFAWLKANYPAGYPINADMFTRMKIMANSGITTVDGITPTELPRDGYVVLAGANVTQGRVATYFHGQLLFFDYPTTFLDNDKNLIYSTNHTRVYH